MFRGKCWLRARPRGLLLHEERVLTIAAGVGFFFFWGDGTVVAVLRCWCSVCECGSCGLDAVSGGVEVHEKARGLVHLESARGENMGEEGNISLQKGLLEFVASWNKRFLEIRT